MGLRIRWEGASDVGLVRQRNEDAWGAVSLGGSGRGAFLAVADGMGGLPGGDVAADLAVRTVLAEAERRAGGTDPAALLRDLFRIAQEALTAEAAARPSLSRMGTTLTLLLVRDDGAWVGHVGDSRLAWQRNGEICLVTADHSVAWELVEAGLLDADLAERDPSGSILTRHLGPGSDVMPDVSSRSLLLAPGDRLLLLSDGLGKVVSMEEVARIVERETIGGAIAGLIRAAIDGGAPDNVTIVIAEVTEPSLSSPGGLPWKEPRYRWRARRADS